MEKLLYENESYLIRGEIFNVYKNLKNFQKEKVYRDALYIGLIAKGLKVEKEKRIDIYYMDKKVGTYVPDIVVNDIIVLELKAKSILTKEDTQQFWHYLRNSKYKVGFLINFGSVNKATIIRRVYDTARAK